MTEYYTTISKKQVNTLYMARNKIKISESMLNYLYALAKQGKGLAKDPAVESFRRTISESVGKVLKIQAQPDADPIEYVEIETEIHRAFRQLSAVKKSRMLTTIKKELDMESVRKRPRTETAKE